MNVLRLCLNRMIQNRLNSNGNSVYYLCPCKLTVTDQKYNLGANVLRIHINHSFLINNAKITSCCFSEYRVPLLPRLLFLQFSR